MRIPIFKLLAIDPHMPTEIHRNPHMHICAYMNLVIQIPIQQYAYG